MPQSAETSDLAAETQRLPGPTILSTRGTVARAVGHRRNRVRAADPEQAIDAGFDRGREHRRIRPRAADDHFANAGSARRNRGHQQRGGQRIPACRHITADARQRHDALLDGDAGGNRDAASLSGTCCFDTDRMCRAARAIARRTRASGNVRARFPIARFGTSIGPVRPSSSRA